MYFYVVICILFENYDDATLNFCLIIMYNLKNDYNSVYEQTLRFYRRVLYADWQIL